ncbi:Uncharacterized protein DAT39_004212 [Clarias magur]|uniref:Uncharacterized protein n=1 Tax=Clarias magur TaxID=1594786 RepID=A0A8J4X6G2_CLAMG|nr:Uncharacterized protein DAT39_004212 [Clarias magur]
MLEVQTQQDRKTRLIKRCAEGHRGTLWQKNSHLAISEKKPAYARRLHTISPGTKELVPPGSWRRQHQFTRRIPRSCVVSELSRVS